MARPTKEGIDYFSFDVAMDTKIELLEAEFGLKGFAVFVKLLQRIYGGHGYYCEWNDEVALLFSKKIGEGCNVVSEIVQASIKRGIFNETIFLNYGVLTSNGIQKRYFDAIKRRTEIEVIKEYLLVHGVKNKDNVHINQVNVNSNSKNEYRNTQRRVKKSKEENTKEPCPTSSKFDESSIEYQLAQRLYEKILLNDSKTKKPNLNKWAEHINKLIRIDKRDVKTVESVIDFATSDNFWKTNILSANKLREKFQQLYLKMNQGTGRIIKDQSKWCDENTPIPDDYDGF